MPEDIFTNNAAEDSSAEDGTIAAVVQDLGDNLIPVPRESSKKSAPEMIHIWEIDVGVSLKSGSGASALAFN